MERKPRVSFGLAIRNGEATLRRCVDSVLAQDFADFELVVSDNASTDSTPAILESYAAGDPRVRFYRNDENKGLIANVNRVFDLARGEYFRWIGVDDWLEPEYASRCVETLDRDSSAIAVTTDFRIHMDTGESDFEAYCGPRVDAEDPVKRLACMLRLLHAGDAKYDPVYSMIHRKVLARTPRIRMMHFADRVLSAELSLLGRFQHIPAILSNRYRIYYPQVADRDALMRRYHPTRYRELPASPLRIYRELLAIIRSASLTPIQRAQCTGLALRYGLIEAFKRLRGRLAKFRRERLGLTRQNMTGSRFFRLRRWEAGE